MTARRITREQHMTGIFTPHAAPEHDTCTTCDTELSWDQTCPACVASLEARQAEIRREHHEKLASLRGANQRRAIKSATSPARKHRTSDDSALREASRQTVGRISFKSIGGA